MKRTTKQPEPGAWRVSIIRSRLTHLGRVYAVDRQGAEDAAVAEFQLRDLDRKRLVIEEGQ